MVLPDGFAKSGAVRFTRKGWGRMVDVIGATITVRSASFRGVAGSPGPLASIKFRLGNAVKQQFVVHGVLLRVCQRFFPPFARLPVPRQDDAAFGPEYPEKTCRIEVGTVGHDKRTSLPGCPQVATIPAPAQIDHGEANVTSSHVFAHQNNSNGEVMKKGECSENRRKHTPTPDRSLAPGRPFARPENSSAGLTCASRT